jgi:hypothetical protein
MSFTLSTFKNALGQGSRPNNFKITFGNPLGLNLPRFTSTIADSGSYSLLCKSAAIPAFTIGVVEIPVQGGRRMKLPGDRTYGDWTATFIADQDQVLRKYFEDWIAGISTNNFENRSKSTIADYKQNIQVQQLDVSGNNIANGFYVLKDSFPTDVSAIDLSYDTTDTISEFSVTFQYSYITYTLATSIATL